MATYAGTHDADIFQDTSDNDTYFVDHAYDNVVELHYEGTDTIYSSVTYSLFERAAETLILTGGTGVDIFVFGAGSGRDIITDFSAAEYDVIDISAYTHGVADLSLVTQKDADAYIRMSTGHAVTVKNTTVADVLAHIVW